jgi:hypothetical protein
VCIIPTWYYSRRSLFSTDDFRPIERFESISLECKFICITCTSLSIFRLVFTSTAQLICAILDMMFITYLMSEDVHNAIRLKLSYFQQFWSFVNLGIISCSWASAAIYFWKYRKSNYIGELFRETNGYVSVNLPVVIDINDTLVALLGFSCIFSTLKLSSSVSLQPTNGIVRPNDSVLSKNSRFLCVDVLHCLCRFSHLLLPPVRLHAVLSFGRKGKMPK